MCSSDLVDELLNARTRNRQVAAARALDRVLLWEHYMIPNWYIDYHRVAHRSTLRSPETPPYSLAIRTWWKE